jgi:hypothetical protein
MSQQQPTMFCNTCKIAGKSQGEYTSHNTKVKNAKTGKVEVMCPVVLAAVCTYCNGTGHWKKYCKILEKDEKNTKKQASTLSYAVVKPKNTEKPLPSNRFSILGDDDAVEEEEQQHAVPENIAAKITWSSVVSKPNMQVQYKAPQPEMTYEGRGHILRSTTVENHKFTENVCFNMETKKAYIKPAAPVVKKAWIDYTSEDEESGSDEE